MVPGHRNRQRFTVKVAAGNHANLVSGIVNENQRVIGDRVELNLKCPTTVSNRVTRRAMYLWDTAQGIGILHIG